MYSRLERVADGRFRAAVENAEYFMVVEAVRGAAGAVVSIERDNGRRMLRIRCRRYGEDSERDDRLVDIGDRVGALDGRRIQRGAELCAEIPYGARSRE